MYAYGVEGACIIETDDNNLGNINIYVPCDRVTDFVIDNHHVINVSSSNITGYFTRSGDDYTISFQPYQYGRYRLSNMSSYQYLDSVETVVNFQTRQPTDNLSFGTTSIIMILVLGGLAWITFIRN